MSFYGNPDELDHLAVQIGRRAEEVRDHASGMDARAGAMRWKSVAADRARETVAGDRRSLDETAQHLDEAAALLRRHAQDVRETIAEIKWATLSMALVSRPTGTKWSDNDSSRCAAFGCGRRTRGANPGGLQCRGR